MRAKKRTKARPSQRAFRMDFACTHAGAIAASEDCVLAADAAVVQELDSRPVVVDLPMNKGQYKENRECDAEDGPPREKQPTLG